MKVNCCIASLLLFHIQNAALEHMSKTTPGHQTCMFCTCVKGNTPVQTYKPLYDLPAFLDTILAKLHLIKNMSVLKLQLVLVKRQGRNVKRNHIKFGEITTTTVTGLRGFLPFFRHSFHALILLPEHTIRMISLTDKPQLILHAEMAQKPLTRTL